jgi:hypothetical protein
MLFFYITVNPSSNKKIAYHGDMDKDPLDIENIYSPSKIVNIQLIDTKNFLFKFTWLRVIAWSLVSLFWDVRIQNRCRSELIDSQSLLARKYQKMLCRESWSDVLLWIRIWIRLGSEHNWLRGNRFWILDQDPERSQWATKREELTMLNVLKS